MSEELSLLEYKKRVIDPISSSFCAAKWLNATIWLGSGRTSSCHHPPSHSIDVEEIKINPSAIHNTLAKKVIRKQMLEGVRPKECEYCWKIEDVGDNIVSDRIFKTIIYPDEKIKEIANLSWKANVGLETLELAFNRVCNLACSYCGPTYSTAWGKEIRDNGAYQGLKGDCNGEFSHDGSIRDFDTSKVENPFIKAFWQWWPTLSMTLKELRITGGEPLMSLETWKLIDKFAEEKLDIRLAINTNLCAKDDLIEKLILKSKQINNLAIYTSCEAVGKQAEYIRDGLNYEKFINNCEKIIETANISSFNVMMTINSLCLFSVTEFLDKILEWKERYKDKNISFSMNTLRFPSFMSPVVLPDHLKKERIEILTQWLKLNTNNPLLSNWELVSLNRLIEYLNNVNIAHSEASVKEIQFSDFKLFYTQYDKRRGKDFRSTFPMQLVEWFDSLVEYKK